MLFFDLIFCILFVDFHIFSFPSFLSYIFFKIFTILSNIYICSFKYIYIYVQDHYKVQHYSAIKGTFVFLYQIRKMLI